MQNLKLIFENIEGKKEIISLPMEKWIADWWFECDIVPENDAIILEAELDGVSIFDKLRTVDGNKIFLSVAEYFNWNNLYNRFIYSITNSNMKNSNAFRNWLLENAE